MSEPRTPEVGFGHTGPCPDGCTCDVAQAIASMTSRRMTMTEPQTPTGKRLHEARLGTLNAPEWDDRICAIEAEAAAMERERLRTDRDERRLRLCRTVPVTMPCRAAASSPTRSRIDEQARRGQVRPPPPAEQLRLSQRAARLLVLQMWGQPHRWAEPCRGKRKAGRMKSDMAKSHRVSIVTAVERPPR